ncbi:MAG: PilN domain-containing protein, partial [Gammaproteobacteria bacterium]|nr:PilN domain-containing protein [Gammaproteobacteria bacterium]
TIEGTAGDIIEGAAGDSIEDTAKSTIEVFFPLGEQALNTRLALLQKHLPETHFTPIATDSAAPAHDMSRAFALAHWRLPPPRPRFRRAPPHTAPAGFIVREAPDYRTAAVHCAVSVMLAFALAIWQTELRSQNEALAAHTQRHAALAAEHRRHASALEEAERRLAHWRRVVEAADALFKRQKDIPALLETLGGAVSAGLRLERLDCISPQVCRLTGFAPSYERIAAFAETLEQAHGVSRVIVGGVTPGGTDAAGRPEKRFELECRLHTGAEAA